MLLDQCITFIHNLDARLFPPKDLSPDNALPRIRPSWRELAITPEKDLPLLVRQSSVALRYLHLLGDLEWEHFPERPTNRPWPGSTPAPRAPFIAAFLVKLQENQPYMSTLRTFLIDNPPLVWLLGFPLIMDDPLTEPSPWGFDLQATVPSAKQMGRVLRTLQPEQSRFFLQQTIRLLQQELPPDSGFGDEISLDTKHIIAWVRENNPKERISDRFNKERRPAGDPECRLGFKSMSNQGAKPAHTSTSTPTSDGLPASQSEKPKEGQYLWGYASGVVAATVNGWGDFVLAEFTQTFDKSDPSYFYPLMEQTEQHLGRKPKSGALDAAFDAFFVYDYFHAAGGFAAVPWADRADHRKSFDEQGLPLCAAGFSMPLRSSFVKRTGCLIPHKCGRFACPLPDMGEHDCPVSHPNWEKQGGCITTLPLSPGNRLRHQLDRESDAYKRLYRQRSAVERINSQAVSLGIERPKLRNKDAIANANTLIYLLINLRALQRVRALKAERSNA